MTFTANDEHDILDGDLVVRVSIRFDVTFEVFLRNSIFYDL